MARWICFYLIFITIFVNQISMRILPNEHFLSRRHLGSALAKYSRAKPNSARQDSAFHRTNEALPSPEFLRSRWMELLNERNQKKDELNLFE